MPPILGFGIGEKGRDPGIRDPAIAISSGRYQSTGTSNWSTSNWSVCVILPITDFYCMRQSLGLPRRDGDWCQKLYICSASLL